MNSFDCYLGSSDGAGKLMAHARLLLRLQRAYQEMAPAWLAGASTVANSKQGIVVIHADNGAVAAKLRQMSSTLAGEFLKRGFECSGVQIRVQAAAKPALARGSQQKPLSARAGATLKDLAGSLPDSPLRAALETLLARAEVVGGGAAEGHE